MQNLIHIGGDDFLAREHALSFAETAFYHSIPNLCNTAGGDGLLIHNDF